MARLLGQNGESCQDLSTAPDCRTGEWEEKSKQRLDPCGGKGNQPFGRGVGGGTFLSSQLKAGGEELGLALLGTEGFRPKTKRSHEFADFSGAGGAGDLERPSSAPGVEGVLGPQQRGKRGAR